MWVHFVTEIARLIERASGRFGIAEDAKKLFEEFYRRFRNRRVAGSALEVTARTHVHAIKFALIYAILAGHCQIEADDIERGVALANYCAEVAEAVSASIGQSKTCAKEQRLLAALRVGRLSTRDAMRRLRCSADDLCRMTRALERLGNIAVIRERSLSGREQVFIESLD